MNIIQPLKSPPSNQHPNSSKSPFTKVPLKFKGIILKSLSQKHRLKELQCMKRALFVWYVQRNEGRMVKDAVDRLLIAEGERGFTKVRFFYRMKRVVRQEQQKQRLTHQQSEYSPFAQANPVPILSSSLLPPTPTPPPKQDSLISSHSPYCHKKNFTQYFQSLKNIFSMKLIDCEAGNNQSDEENNNKNMEDMDRKKGVKKLRYKTEGGEKDGGGEGESGDDGFSMVEKFSDGEGSEGVGKQQTYGVGEQREWEKEMRVKQFGVKVALTLIKSFLLNQVRTNQHQAFTLIKHASQHHKTLTLPQNAQTCLNHLKLLAIDSSSSQSSTPTPQQPLPSFSFIQTSPSLSSTHSIPPLSSITSQINQIEYSISLLQGNLKKDEDLKQLYRDFNEQFREVENIEREFEGIRVRTRGGIGERVQQVQRKVVGYLLGQAFMAIKMVAIASRTQQQSRKPDRSHTQAVGLSRSRVNIQTLHQLFSKPLLLPQPSPYSQEAEIPHNNNTTPQKSSRRQLEEITSIKLVGDHRYAKTEEGFFCQKQEGQKVVRSGIRKQTVKTVKSVVGDDDKKEMNQLQQEEVLTSLNSNMLKEKPTNVQLSKALSSIENMKSRVNFAVPASSPSGSSSNLSTSSFKKAQHSPQHSLQQPSTLPNQLQPHTFYNLSVKTLESNDSSQSRKYHAEIKSQFWWNDDCLEGEGCGDKKEG